MTAADEARFIRLYQQGASYRAIAQALGCSLGTVASRSAALVAQGRITPLPRGGAKARQDDTPAPARAPAITMVAVPELREIITRFSTLEARVAALEDGTRDATRTPPAPAPAPHPRIDIKQWTVRLSQPLIEAVKTGVFCPNPRKGIFQG